MSGRHQSVNRRHAFLVKGIVDMIAFSFPPYKSDVFKNTQVLRDCRLRDTQIPGQSIDANRSRFVKIVKKPDELQPGRVAERFEQSGEIFRADIFLLIHDLVYQSLLICFMVTELQIEVKQKGQAK